MRRIWLRKQWANVHRLRQDGVPVLGFTWYSLPTRWTGTAACAKTPDASTRWDSSDLDRALRPVGHAYGKLIRQWRDVLPTEGPSLDLHLS